MKATIIEVENGFILIFGENYYGIDIKQCAYGGEAYVFQDRKQLGDWIAAHGIKSQNNDKVAKI
jgi:hypothetical protein